LRASGSAWQNRTEPRVGCTDGIAHSGVIGATPDRTYVLHSWSLVKIGTTAQKKLFFDLRRLKGQMQTVDDGDLQPRQVGKIARMLDVRDEEVVRMNRRLAGSDRILNVPARRDSRDEWQVWLVDEAEGHERTTAIVLHILATV
jgi:DNA-directed RNA polymerase sigma subunit (sigma70/sigma32)